MMTNNQDRASILTEALPYIQKYSGKILVVKYGGNAMVNEEIKNAVIRDLILLKCIGIKVVLVHGGGPEINDTLCKMGKEIKFVNGLRYTDEETAEIVQMVLSGKVNKSLVALITRNGGKAIGLCGLDGGMIEVSMQNKELGFVGKIEKINTDIILDCLSNGYIPVISTIGMGKDNKVYNVNADTAAASIAGALQAESLILMSDIKGLLADKNDENTLIEKVYVSDIPMYIKEGIISGGMIPKVDCCGEALRRGVKKVFILDGRVPHSILIEVLTNEGIGTMFVKGDGYEL
ncbi:acetylglutamate kinase [bacterium]|nr:acetylglutamate kinase [bacterium]